MPTPEDCGTLEGYLRAIDALAAEMQRKWGWGRLPRLVGAREPDLLARFTRQQATWSMAYQAAWEAPVLTRDLLAAVQQKSGAMQRAWNALDANAEEAGERPLAPFVWTAQLADGSLAAIVQTDAEASAVIALAQAEGRPTTVFTLDEIGNLIDAIPGALQLAKAAWPDAKFIARKLPPGPAWDDDGDEIPF